MRSLFVITLLILISSACSDTSQLSKTATDASNNTNGQQENIVAQTNTSPDTSTQNEETSASILTVYKSATCGCCGAWVDHMNKSGLKPAIIEDADLNSVKARFGIPTNARSCHTAIQNEYVFEGHVPAKYVQQFLSQPPESASGLIVPGMPIGSPGMEDGDRFQPYAIWQLNKDGSIEEYARTASYQDQF